MNLREARKVKVGDSILTKEDKTLLTVKRATFGRKGIGYATDCIIFEVFENEERYGHRGVTLYKKGGE